MFLITCGDACPFDLLRVHVSAGSGGQIGELAKEAGAGVAAGHGTGAGRKEAHVDAAAAEERETLKTGKVRLGLHVAVVVREGH